jgi:hypothetical protein
MKKHTKFLCKTLFNKVIREVNKKNKNQALVKCNIPKKTLLGVRYLDGGKKKKLFVESPLRKMQVTATIKQKIVLSLQTDYDGFSQFYDLMLDRDDKNKVSLNDDVLSVVRGFLTHVFPFQFQKFKRTTDKRTTKK